MGVILSLEDLLMEALCFDIYVDHPTSHMDRYLIDLLSKAVFTDTGASMLSIRRIIMACRLGVGRFDGQCILE
jgi:hypothetical protein